MRYYSTNGKSPMVGLKEAVVGGLAPDGGLYMPENINIIPYEFFENIEHLSFQDISLRVAKAFFGEDVPENILRDIVYDTLNFDAPIVHIEGNIYALELFHGPTMAFKDVGARFMSRLLAYFVKNESGKLLNVLVATSGDTGSAVANGFLGVEGVNVYVLYPKDKVSEIQEMQFVTLGHNITAIEVDGTFDDCQALVKSAFVDDKLNEHINLTSANSINVARFLPQAFYYFYAYAQMKKEGKHKNLVFSVPSGNFGNITAGLIAKAMGLPVKRFVAANNSNDIFCKYLATGVYDPKPSVATIANAMDVGAPSNFVRMFDLYHKSLYRIKKDVSCNTYTDQEIGDIMKNTFIKTGYLLDPHGSCGYGALESELKYGEFGVFLETAHPAKFRNTVNAIIGRDIEVPQKLIEFMKGEKRSVLMSKDYSQFRSFLMNI